MKLLMHMQAFDMLDQVTWSITVKDYHDWGADERPEAVVEIAGVVQGTGEDDPRQWLEDVLVAALEHL